jgi:hypothetical protein
VPNPGLISNCNPNAEPQTLESAKTAGLSWRWRPAGGFFILHTFQKRQRDAGATTHCVACFVRRNNISHIGKKELTGSETTRIIMQVGA